MEVKHLVFRIQWRSGRVTGESSCLSGIQSELVFWCSQPELLVSNEESLMYLVKGGEGPAGVFFIISFLLSRPTGPHFLSLYLHVHRPSFSQFIPCSVPAALGPLICFVGQAQASFHIGPQDLYMSMSVSVSVCVCVCCSNFSVVSQPAVPDPS